MKWFGATLGVSLLVAALFIVNAIWFKPFSINVFYQRAFLEQVLEHPEWLTSIRLLEPLGITGHNGRLADESPAHTRQRIEMIQRNASMLRSYDRSSLKGQTALSYDVLDWSMQSFLEGIPYTWHGYPVNQLFGVQNDLPEFMVNQHPLDSEQGAEYYIARLESFDTKFSQVLEDLRLRESMGIIPPRFSVEKVVDEMRGFVSIPIQANILYTHFEETVGHMEELPDDRQTELIADVFRAMDESVYPAYRSLIDYFVTLRSKATTNHGVWKLPAGDEYYEYLLRSRTTTNMSADEIHRLGLQEVARIQAEMDAILQDQGYQNGSVATRMTTLSEEPRFLYANTEEGRTRILEDFQGIIDEISAGMAEWFITLPTSSVEVVRVPPFRQEGAPSAYYQSPPFDGSRPGRFFVNLRDLNEHPKYGMRTLAYHEAVPGHHTESAIQIELEDVPQFRRDAFFTAFSEGWALYAERLAWEAGYQQDPFDNLGRLQAELFRAARMVVDTGIHRKRWSREQSIEYMLLNTGLARDEVVTEIERYFVLPGQATTYKVGMIRILQLRDRARATLGEEFDMRRFHEAILRNGPLPLAILEREIDAWIAAGGKPQA